MPEAPASLPRLDTEALRRELAGLVDPSPRPGSTERQEIAEAASRLCSILASLFGDDLDRLTLWSRIDSAIATACAKVTDGDLDRLVSLCLEHVKASPGAAAANPALGDLLATIGVRPQPWRQEFAHHLVAHRYAVLVHGRARWERVKSKEAEL